MPMVIIATSDGEVVEVIRMDAIAPGAISVAS